MDDVLFCVHMHYASFFGEVVIRSRNYANLLLEKFMVFSSYIALYIFQGEF